MPESPKYFSMGKGGLALGAVTAVLAGVLWGSAGANPVAITPISGGITINGQSANVFSMSLNGSGGMAATGEVAYPQSFPASSSANSVPPTILRATPTLGSQPLLNGLQVGPGPGVILGASSGGATLNTPFSLSLNPVSLNAPAAPSVSDYSCATYRPDFRYSPAKLGFDRQSTTSLAQKDMNFWPGLPPGTNRYVPLGEF